MELVDIAKVQLIVWGRNALENDCQQDPEFQYNVYKQTYITLFLALISAPSIWLRHYDKYRSHCLLNQDRHPRWMWGTVWFLQLGGSTKAGWPMSLINSVCLMSKVVIKMLRSVLIQEFKLQHAFSKIFTVNVFLQLVPPSRALYNVKM